MNTPNVTGEATSTMSTASTAARRFATCATDDPIVTAASTNRAVGAISHRARWSGNRAVSSPNHSETYDAYVPSTVPPPAPALTTVAGTVKPDA